MSGTAPEGTPAFAEQRDKTMSMSRTPDTSKSSRAAATGANGHLDVSRNGARSASPAPASTDGDTPFDSSKTSMQLGPYTFKVAETEDEFEQIHRLNYRTFVEEIGEYPDVTGDTLVDKFHDKNIYFIGIRDGRVVAMLAVHNQPPFSTTERLPDPSMIESLPAPMEVRLLAIEPDERHGIAFAGNLWFMIERAIATGHSHLIISGVTDKEKMYARMGFQPMGPAVPKGNVSFIPMVLDLGRIPGNIRRHMMQLRRRLERLEAAQPSRPISLLPGPVQISSVVQRAMRQHPESHRGKSFVDRFERIRQHLSEIAGGPDVAMLCGSGTLANEAVAATLAGDRALKRGLILNNGEFGRRLVTQAKRYGLDFEVLEWDWGRPIDYDEVEKALKRHDDINWIWAVHLESSTGVLNDLDLLKSHAAKHDARLCMDCVSSFGATPTDLRGVHLATGVSGKAIGSLAGCAFVFVGKDALIHVDRDRVPVYLDVKTTVQCVGPRFTWPSPSLLALDRALETYATPARVRMRYEQYTEIGRYVRSRLNDLGLHPLAPEDIAAPVITTFRPPHGYDSRDFCTLSLSWGYEIAGFSGYLLDRGYIQIATMGAVKKRDCAEYFAKLEQWMRDRKESPAASRVESR